MNNMLRNALLRQLQHLASNHWWCYIFFGGWGRGLVQHFHPTVKYVWKSMWPELTSEQCMTSACYSLTICKKSKKLMFIPRTATLFYILDDSYKLIFIAVSSTFIWDSFFCVSLGSADLRVWTSVTLTSQLRQMWRNVLVLRADKQHVHLGSLWF